MNFFIATIWSQYRYMLDSIPLAERINDTFDIALPIAGVVAVPFIGVILDNLAVPSVLLVLVAISTAFGVLGALPYLWAGYANVILFCLFRPLYYSAMSDYAAKVFGFATFGTIYGTIICLSGLLTFAQSAIQALTHDIFHDNPQPVNLVLAGIALLVGVALVAYVTIAGRIVQEEIADEEERRSLMPQDTPRLGPQYGTSPYLGPRDMTSPVLTARGPRMERPSFANLRDRLSTVQENRNYE